MKITAVLFGILLLLPGLCSLFSSTFVVPMLLSVVSHPVFFNDAISLAIIWLVGFGSGALGIWIIKQNVGE